ncbi:MAG: hypothetical protein MUC81_12790 [Bacteroidia bacterium]|nr:hypothetical protein [Bacteroidia bacterium]
MEHTEIIHLIDLFDEFYLFDQKEQTTSPVTTSTTVEQVPFDQTNKIRRTNL